MTTYSEELAQLRQDFVELYDSVYYSGSSQQKKPEWSHEVSDKLNAMNFRMTHLLDLVTTAKEQLFIAEVKADIKKNKPAQPKDMAVTICPEESSYHQCLFDIIRRIQDEPHIVSGKYCLEQRSKEEEKEKGWHLHLYIQTHIKPSKLHQYITQRLNKRPTVNAFVVVKPCFNSAWEQNYMRGYKGDDLDKKAKCDKDKILRQQYQLQDIYDLKSPI